MNSKRLIAAALAGTALTSCSTLDPVTGSVDRHFGEEVAWNKAVQVINPDPVYPEDGAKPGDNGDVAAAATKRYRTDQVKAVEKIETTQSTSGSGSGSGPR